MNSSSRIALGLMTLTSIWFGLQSWMTQQAIHASSALSFNTERYVIAAVVMGAICIATRTRFTKRAILAGIATGTAFAVMIGFESQSLALGSAGRVTFLGSLFVAIMPFAGSVLRREKLFSAAILGSAIMLTGAWQLLFNQAGNNSGDLFGVLRAAACTVMLLLVGHFTDVDWRVSCFINMTVVAAFSLASAVIADQTQFSLQPVVLVPAVVSALIGSVVCLAVVTWAGRHLSGTLMGVIFCLDSPFTVIWGILLSKELLTVSSLLAYVLIGIGALLTLTAGMYQLPLFNAHMIDLLKWHRVGAQRISLATIPDVIEERA